MLDTVNLNHIVTREGGWDTAADWKVMIMMDGEHPDDDDAYSMITMMVTLTREREWYTAADLEVGRKNETFQSSPPSKVGGGNPP